MEILKNEGGYLKYTLIEGDYEVPTRIILHHIWVDKDKRMKGYGSDLLNKLNEIAKEKGIQTIFINVTDHNKEFKSFLNQNFYAKHPNKELWWIRPIDYAHLPKYDTE
jgi:GNAT superfamily N-acetyltransferase